mgnify:CR=1 FL=1
MISLFSKLGLRARPALQRLPKARMLAYPRYFSTTPEDPTTSTEEKKVSYTFDADDIKGNTRGKGGTLLMAFTCTVCDTKQARTFNKDSYTKGVVLLRCGGCDNLHLIADNLGWFRDGKTNIQDIMKEKGDTVKTNIDDNSIAFDINYPEEEKPIESV